MKWRFSRRRPALASLLTVGLAVVMVSMAPSLLGWAQGQVPARTASPGVTVAINPADPNLASGDCVSFQCQKGTISVGGKQICSDGSATQIECVSGSCQASLAGQMNSGVTFGDWQASGDASIVCTSCLSTTLKTTGNGGVETGTVKECTGGPQISAGYAIQSGYRQVWVNWSDPEEYSTTFQWGTTTSYGLPVPSLSGRSVNLNALTAATTYYYKITDTTNCGAVASVAGTFVTSAAPANEFVGWVSTLVPNSLLLDQVGSPIAGATLGEIWANCVNPNDLAVRIAFPTGVSTDSNGHYTLSFPLKWTYAGYTYYDLWPNGWCKDNTWSGTNGNVSNSELTLNMSAQGHWNATESVSSTNSGANDYHQFGLPANEPGVAVPGIAFVHTPLVKCGVTIENGLTRTVDSYVAGDGFDDTKTYGEVLTGNPVSNGDSSVSFDYHTTGWVNETGKPTIADSYAVGDPYNPGTNAISPPDPDASPPTGSSVWSYGGTGGSIGWYNGGSYTSTAGLDMQLSVTGGWGGLSFGPSFDLVYTTTTGVSSLHEIVCSSVSDPPTGYDYQFYTYIDGTDSTSGQAINVHIWYDDECVQGSTGCP